MYSHVLVKIFDSFVLILMADFTVELHICS